MKVRSRQLAQSLHSGLSRQRQIQEQNIRPQLQRQRHSGFAIGGLAHDLHIPLASKQGAQAGPDQIVVLNDENANVSNCYPLLNGLQPCQLTALPQRSLPTSLIVAASIASATTGEFGYQVSANFSPRIAESCTYYPLFARKLRFQKLPFIETPPRSE